MMVAIKTLIFTVLVPGTVAIYIPYLLIASEPAAQRLQLGVFRYASLIMILIGVAFYFRRPWDFTFTGKGTPAPIDPPKELVARGLYRFVRNPMYVGMLSLFLGEAVFFKSGRMLLYTAVAFLVYHSFVVLYEEPVLRRKFGEAYQRYCDGTPRWIPRLKR
jgi:protein-S-isoprenylcysteine O-methyltransferase Ste14